MKEASMQTYTVTEAASLLVVTKETLHSWLVALGIDPIPDPRDRRRHVITYAHLVTLAEVHHRAIAGSDSPIAPTSHAAEIAALRAQVARLEQILTRRTESTIAPIVSTHTRNLAPSPVALSESTYRAPQYDGMPQGSILAVHFARAHDFNQGTLKSQLKDQRPDLVTEIERGWKDGSKDQWVTPVQQAGLIELWKSRHSSYEKCTRSDCVCQQ